MTPIFIAGLYTAVENTRTLARSALPDAPVIPDEPRRTRTRVWVGAVLRSAARHAQKLADRIDPRFKPQTAGTTHVDSRLADPVGTP